MTIATESTTFGANVVQDEIPLDDRIGRRLANGRFEVTEWIGFDRNMGCAIARDAQQGGLVRLTFAGDVSRSADELRSVLTRDVPGLASVRYLGATDADDKWAPRSLMMAEQLPPGTALDLDTRATPEQVAAFGVRLARVVAGVHRGGTILGTIRPESTFVTTAGDIELVSRGERLWFMPRPNMMRSTMLSPWAPGYMAPELLTTPILEHPDPAADVFSVGVMLGTWLLGRFVYEAEGAPQLFVAQMRGVHLPLPSTALGDLLTRCLSRNAAARPSIVDVEQALQQLAN